MLNKVHGILEINCLHENQYYELYIFSQIQNEDLEKPLYIYLLVCGLRVKIAKKQVNSFH